MIVWLLKQLPLGLIAGVAILVVTLQVIGIDVAGMASNFVLDLLGVPDWSGMFGGLL
ncbi:hypothetical protein [Haloferax profundi]|uniref:hypothetical protein n=1 Tax=Haloferax profundi TaxID=1544718 RepID=UPI000A4070E9|nr:hypothetical protein [Haloferax profundi]